MIHHRHLWSLSFASHLPRLGRKFRKEVFICPISPCKWKQTKRFTISCARIYKSVSFVKLVIVICDQVRSYEAAEFKRFVCSRHFSTLWSAFNCEFNKKVLLCKFSDINLRPEFNAARRTKERVLSRFVTFQRTILTQLWRVMVAKNYRSRWRKLT